METFVINFGFGYILTDFLQVLRLKLAKLTGEFPELRGHANVGQIGSVVLPTYLVLVSPRTLFQRFGQGRQTVGKEVAVPAATEECGDCHIKPIMSSGWFSNYFMKPVLATVIV